MLNNLDKLAERTGLPIEVVRRGVYHMERKAIALKRRPNARFLQAEEYRLERNLAKYWAEQIKYIVEDMKDLSIFATEFRSTELSKKEIKLLDNEIDEMIKLMPRQEEIADAIAATSARVMLKGGRFSIRKYKLGTINISFNLKNELALRYLRSKRDIMLSDRQGSINKTTKDRLLGILKNGVNDGKSYTQLAKEIVALSDKGVFSASRAQMIATNEIGKAYEFGNYVPVQEYSERTGKRVKKYWNTVRDNNVTKECEANELHNGGNGIELDEAFPSGDAVAPRSSHPRCRCNVTYDVVL